MLSERYLTAASRSQETRDGWPNIISDCETYSIPVSFNICGYEAVFGDNGPNEVNEIDIYHPWHSDTYWSTNTWYSDTPPNGGNYMTVGNLSGYSRNYNLIYGGDLTEPRPCEVLGQDRGWCESRGNLEPRRNPGRTSHNHHCRRGGADGPGSDKRI